MEPSWWNLIPTYFDGIAFTIPLMNFPVHWYGVMYIFAFVTAYFTMWKINSKENLGYTKEQFDNLFMWAIAGILIGARLGYVFFYKPGYYLANPLEIIIPLTHDALGWHFTGIAGMSYHGGMILGTIFAIIGMKRNKMDVWKTLNLSFLAAPLAYTWGRWGNFINGELFGAVSDVNVYGVVWRGDHEPHRHVLPACPRQPHHEPDSSPSEPALRNVLRGNHPVCGSL